MSFFIYINIYIYGYMACLCLIFFVLFVIGWFMYNTHTLGHDVVISARYLCGFDDKRRHAV